MFVLMIIHLVQSIASLVFNFGISNNRSSTLFCVFVGALTPFVAYIYILAETIILSECDTLLRTWLITDLIILAISAAAFSYRSLRLYRKRDQLNLFST